MKKRCWQRINKLWLPEIILLGGLAFSFILFLLSNIFNINFWTEAQRFGIFFKNVIQWLLTPTTYIGIIILISFLYFLLARIRYHILRLANTNLVCPVCHCKLNKRHRNTYQRLLSYYIPVRRYYCRYCSWKGLRVHIKKQSRDKG